MENAKLKKNWIYETNDNNSARFLLGQISSKPIICIGVNPSTASLDALDQTTKSVKRISLQKGFDSWIMANLYPQRATNPNQLHTRCHSNLHQKNLAAIKQLFRKLDKFEIWAAWGVLIEKRAFLVECLYDITMLAGQYSSTWTHMGEITKSGHPRHPLYLRSDSVANAFHVNKYLKNFER